MTKGKSKSIEDIEEIDYRLDQRLLAFASMLEAFEVAAQVKMEGNSAREIDTWGMFTQCNFAMAEIMDQYQKLKAAVLGR